jgi:hypothetical protein
LSLFFSYCFISSPQERQLCHPPLLRNVPPTMWTQGIPEDGDSVSIRGMSAMEVRSNDRIDLPIQPSDAKKGDIVLFSLCLTIGHNGDVTPSRMMSQTTPLKSNL